MMPYNLIEAQTDQRIPAAERTWARTALTAMPAREAYTKAPWLKGRYMVDRDGNAAMPFFFRCRHFDAETRTCLDYANRPPVCRDYPWYGMEPREDASLPPDCSYRSDLIQIGAKP
jgi:Fe-S-cluster containining protein